MMTESEYLALADETFRRIEDLFEDVDADDVDLDRAGDVVTLTFGHGGKCIVNTQRPTRQIWLAAGARAWHFDWDGARWVDDKDKTAELFGVVAHVVKDQAGVDVALR